MDFGMPCNLQSSTGKRLASWEVVKDVERAMK